MHDVRPEIYKYNCERSELPSLFNARAVYIYMYNLASGASPTLIVQLRKIFVILYIYIYIYMFCIYVYIYIYIYTSVRRARAVNARATLKRRIADRPAEVQWSIIIIALKTATLVLSCS